MTPRARLLMVVLAGAGFAAFFLWGLSGLPDFGHYHGVYGQLLNEVSVPERNITDVVTAVNFDYRGFDTMGEEFILFASVIAVALLLRAQRDEVEQTDSPDARIGRQAEVSDAVRVLGMGLIAPTVVFGIYVVAHGHLTPGGGFQGGVVLASALLLVYLAGEYRWVQELRPLPLVEAAEAFGGGGYVLIGLAGMVFGVAFLDNVLPYGTLGQLNSGGVVPLINFAVGLEVAAGFVLLLTEFFEQSLILRRLAERGGTAPQ